MVRYNDFYGQDMNLYDQEYRFLRVGFGFFFRSCQEGYRSCLRKKNTIYHYYKFFFIKLCKDGRQSLSFGKNPSFRLTYMQFFCHFTSLTFVIFCFCLFLSMMSRLSSNVTFLSIQFFTKISITCESLTTDNGKPVFQMKKNMSYLQLINDLIFHHRFIKIFNFHSANISEG